MRRTFFKSKIHRATVTDANLHYQGSVTVDPVLLKAADIVPWERVECVDLERGEESARWLVTRSGFTRLPVLRAGPDKKRVVVGYLHQLDVLGAAPDEPLERHLRPIEELPADLVEGQAPLGAATLQEVVECRARRPCERGLCGGSRHGDAPLPSVV